MPPGMGRIERQDIGNLYLAQSRSQTAILAIEGVGDYCPERPLLLNRVLDELQGNLGFGTERRIVLALSKIALRRVWLDLQRVIDLFVGPQATHGDDAVLDLANVAQVLARHMRRFVSVFAISCLIDDQGSLPVGSRRRVIT